MFAEKIRLKLADWLVGNKTVLFSSKENLEKAKTGDFASMDDAFLGLVTRRWLDAIAQVYQTSVKPQGAPVALYTAQNAVLALARIAQDVNSTDTTIAVRGSVDGGKTEHTWVLNLTMDNDYEFSDKKVEETRDPNDPSKITSLAVNWQNPSYYEWKQEHAATE